MLKGQNEECLPSFSLCSQTQWGQSETRGSSLRSELAAVKEALQQGDIERQLLETEKNQLTDALSRVWIFRFHFICKMSLNKTKSVLF